MKSKAMGDKVAIGLSLLCLMHCLLLPVLLLVLPTATIVVALTNEFVHKAILFSVVPVSLAALYFGYRKHGSKALVVMGLMGLLLLLSAIFAHDLVGHTGEIVLTVLGSVLLVVGHFRNYRLSRAANA